jgi:hypothetical protein
VLRAAGIGWIIADDDGLDDRENLVAGHADAPRMRADRFSIARLEMQTDPNLPLGSLTT